MKTLLITFLGVFSLAASASPVVLSRLTVCPEKQPTQPLTVTWTQEDHGQSITFSNADGSATYAVVKAETPQFGGSTVTYVVPSRGQEHVTIFCDAIMTNSDQLMMVSDCGNND
jgi:hypothetical protein